jgi:hypothetical protein
MIFKEPASITTLPLSTFILNKSGYKIDRTYQRESGTWSGSDQQYLIDSILRGYPMPPIFIHNKNHTRYIVDGQQRFHTILRFKENKFRLSDKYSEEIISDKQNREKNKGNGAYLYSQLGSDWQDRFVSYPIPIITVTDYNDEEIRDLFRRLQHGKPLIPGEILNAYPGNIVSTMRKLSNHKFFSNILPISPKRYKHYFISAQIMYLESEGIRDIGTGYIYKFFDNNRNLSLSSGIYNRVDKTLNFIVRVFKDKTPEIRKPGWFITLYLLTSHLRENYSMKNQESNLKIFVVEFYKKVMDSPNTGTKNFYKFYSAVSKSTTKQSNIKYRYDFILQKFIEKYNPIRLDEDRLFTNEQKIKIFRHDKEICRICREKLTFGKKNTHYHHQDRYVEGGRTDVDNGILVCRKCHLSKIHAAK